MDADVTLLQGRALLPIVHAPGCSVVSRLPDWLYRLLKLEPIHYHGRHERWENRTYPCRRWYCFRRSPAWRSFKRGEKSWCDRHVPFTPWWQS